MTAFTVFAGTLWIRPAEASAKGTDTNYSQVNPSVASGARQKYTKIKGKGKDTVTLMLYMIGTDLESGSGMATADLNEMLYAQMSNSKLNIYVETGGCKRWKNSVIASGKIQRWHMTGEGLELDETLGKADMTEEANLRDFISYCKGKAPADRYMLILWDHGGGSVSGYGYDELFPNGSMDISEIAAALKESGVKFDFVGFDACLMATLETAIALAPYADYLIASEESEPGTGWYYTNWLKLLDKSTSTDTLEIGRTIIDDFIFASKKTSPGSQTTLSLTDLSELQGTVVKELTGFGASLTAQLQSMDYQTVAEARASSREFSPSSRLDQVDLVDFCLRLGSEQGKSLSQAVQSAVKYNRACNIQNAYGLSIYFPNKSLRSVNSMVQIYDKIGIDSSWKESVRAYATLENSGQIASGSSSAYGSGSGSLIDTLLGGLSGYSGYADSSYSSSSSQGSSYGSSYGYDSYSSMGLEDMLGLLTGYGYSGYADSSSQSQSSSSSSGSSWLDSALSYFLDDSAASSSYGYGYGYDSYGSSYGQSVDLFDSLFGGYTSTDGTTYGGVDYSSLFGGSNTSTAGSLLELAAQMLLRSPVVGSVPLEIEEKDGERVLSLSEDMWSQILAADLNVFVYDGEGFLDLGLDNVADYNDDGDLIVDWDHSWLTLEGQPVAVYPISDEDEDGNGFYITRKFIPAMLNGERVNLIIEFNEETGEDKVLGAQSVTQTGVQGKGYTPMEAGDEIVLVCDYYTCDGTFQAQYTLGDPILYPEDGELALANMEITGGEDSSMLYTYRLTDIYQASYWAPMTFVEG